MECRNGISKAYACIIPNKEKNTIIPIIEKFVYAGSTIWTDEHRSYRSLRNMFNHSTVRHKYEFVNATTGTNTQSVESFHNELKLQIKREKGVKTKSRAQFLRYLSFF